MDKVCLAEPNSLSILAVLRLYYLYQWASTNMGRKVISNLAYYAAQAFARDNECWRHHAKMLRHTINQDAKECWS